MFDFEIFSTGGAWFLFNFFNAIAAITKSADYKNLIIAAMLTGSGWVLLSLAFEPGTWNKVANWLAVSTVVIAGFLSPSATIKVTDTISRTDSSGYIVANVPYGLALFAGLSSKVGYELTELFETNFSDTDAPTLQKHGFLFGTKLFDEATRMEIQDVNFAKSLNSYIRNCVFYDLATGRKNIEDLKNAADPWTWITTDPHKARWYENYQGARTAGTEDAPATSTVNSKIESCVTGAATLKVAMTKEVETAKKVLGARVGNDYTSKTRTAVNALLATQLGDMHTYLLGASKTATEILQGQMVINAVIKAPEQWMAENNNDAALKSYIDARLQLQTRQSYDSIGRQAGHWLPILKTVFQCIYIGIFPLAVLLMVTPIGPAVIKNYILGLLWVESWQPLYALLNYMMYTRASAQMKSILEATNPGETNNSITLFAQAGIQTVENDIAIQAGYLSMSIPFIAIGLAMGVGRFAALATSTLAISQEAVAATTTESATGNLALGNVQTGTQSSNNLSSNQQNTSMFSDWGRTSGYGADGLLHTANADGSQTVQAGSAVSSGRFDFKFGDAERSAIDDSYSLSNSQAISAQKSMTDSQSRLQQSNETFSNILSKHENAGIAYSEGSKFSESDDLKTVNSGVESLSKSTGLTHEESVAAIQAFNTEAGMSFEKWNGKISAVYTDNDQWTEAANLQETFNKVQDISERKEFSEAFNRVQDASLTNTAGTTFSDGTTIGETFTAQQDDLQSKTDTYSQLNTQTEQIAQVRSENRSQDAGYTENMNDAFKSFVGAKLFSGDPNADQKANTFINSTDPNAQEIVRGFANEFIGQEVTNRINAHDDVNLPTGYVAEAQAFVASDLNQPSLPAEAAAFRGDASAGLAANKEATEDGYGTASGTVTTEIDAGQKTIAANNANFTRDVNKNLAGGVDAIAERVNAENGLGGDQTANFEAAGAAFSVDQFNVTGNNTNPGTGQRSGGFSDEKDK